MMLLLSSIIRIAVIATGNYTDTANEQSKYRINLSRMRGTIYDCNMVPLTNNGKKTVAAVLPTPRGIIALNSCMSSESLKNVLEILKENKPAVCEVNNTISSEGIAFTTLYEQNKEKLSACHLIGYTDSTGHGVTGLQKAYDDFLYSDKYVSAVFTTGGANNFLEGIDPYFENDLRIVKNGVVTTLDINIQNIVEAAASKMNSGCAIVADAKSGKIRAMASVPTFDINNIGDSLTKDNSPMINRALSAYSVGSVFKPCVAATAIKMGKEGLFFKCEGSVEIADRQFRCHNLLGHGDMNLCDAIAQSCNCYFYNISSRLDGESIYKMASSLNFGCKIRLAPNFYTANGEIPSIETLENEAALANVSIGQGRLLLSPFSMLTLYLSIAGDGSYYLPSVVEKTIKNGTEDVYDFGSKTRVMSDRTAAQLREFLKSVVIDGTGKEARPTLTTAAGKTATAQTGRYYENGTEITNSWFCGFFPAENPKYVAVVMSDSKLNVSTASIFAQIADEITALNYKNVENND